jgi:hypothetical protein
MIDIAILIAIVIMLVAALYWWNKKRQGIMETQKVLSETSPPSLDTPEDKLVVRLLEKIKAGSAQVYLGTFESRQVFSDGRFMEFDDRLPPAVERLRDLSTQHLPEDTIKQNIPPIADGLAEKVYGVKEHGGKYELLSKTHRSIVDALYYDYLRMRYPKAEVFCRGKTQPILFIQDGVIRAVLMPMKE